MAEVELPKPEEVEESRDRSFSHRVALITAVYAVVLAIAGLGGKNAMKEMLLAQQQASDQWAFYQAKALREHVYASQRVSAEETLAGPVSDSERRKLQTIVQRLGTEEARFRTEKAEIEKEARRLEHERDRYRARDPYFDYAEVFLQIAIVLASVSIISTSPPLFWFSTVLAVIGAVLTVNGFTLAIPFLRALHG